MLPLGYVVYTCILWAHCLRTCHGPVICMQLMDAEFSCTPCMKKCSYKHATLSRSRLLLTISWIKNKVAIQKDANKKSLWYRFSRSHTDLVQVSANTPKSGTGGSIPSGLPDAAQYTGKPNFLAILSTSQKLNLRNILKVKVNSFKYTMKKLRSSRKAHTRSPTKKW